MLWSPCVSRTGTAFVVEVRGIDRRRGARHVSKVLILMNRLKRLNQRLTDWEIGHPWLYALLEGGVAGTIAVIVSTLVIHSSIRDGMRLGLILAITAIFMARFYTWPMMQRRRQNLPSGHRRAWETAFAAGLLSMLATWNLVLLIFGHDTGFAFTIGSGIVVGIGVALLVHHQLAHL